MIEILVLILILCFLVLYLVFCVSELKLAVKNSKPIIIDNKPANLEGKLEYNEVEIYSKHIKGELICFIKYSYSGQVVRERAVDDILYSWPHDEEFKFKFSGMTGYI